MNSPKNWSRRDFLSAAGCCAGAALAGIPFEHAAGQSLPYEPISNDALEAWLASGVATLERKGLYASALFAEGWGLNASANREEQTLEQQSRRASVVFQVWDGLRFHEASTNRIEGDSIKRLVRELADRLERPGRDVVPIDPGPPLIANRATPRTQDPDQMPPAAWKDRAVEILDRVHAQDGRIRSATASVSSQRVRKLFVNRTRRLHQDHSYTNAFAFVLAEDQGQFARVFHRDRRLAGFELTQFGEPWYEEISLQIDDLLGAERIEPGSYDVISEPEITGLLVHESFGHGVEYDQFVKGRARAAQFLGKRVAPEWVDIWDDPTRFDANGSYYFDDEGYEAAPTQIVANGIFVQPLTDLFSSHETGMRRTANGRREAPANKAYARMSNTFFGPGQMRPEDMIAGLDHGVLLAGFQSGIEDPHGWGIQFTCNHGYEIKNGKKTGRVFAPVGVTGYVPDILGSITQVGNVFRLTPGTCGKGFKEFVPIGSGGPHLRFRAQLA